MTTAKDGGTPPICSSSPNREPSRRGGGIFTIGRRLWLPLALAAWATAAAGQELAFTRDASGAKISGPGFTATFASQGAGLTVERGGETVLKGWAASDSDGAFEKGGKAAKIGDLQTASRSGETIVLDYQTSIKDSLARIEVRPRSAGIRLTVRLLHVEADMTPGFAWNMDSAGLWYGGGFQGFRDPQIWPLNQASILSPTFLVSSFSQATPLWYTTKGVAVWVRTPLDFHYSVNRKTAAGRDGLLGISMPKASALEYDILVRKDFREVTRAYLAELGRPRRVPPRELFELPIYTTWVEHKAEVDQAKVLDYARAIRANGLPAGVIELDDKWEKTYGDMEFDTNKFPNPRAMCDELHRLGFRVTLWVHPFINTEARTFAEHQEDGLLLRDANRRVALIRWWNGPAAVWDFTDPQAGALFRSRLDGLMARFGFDGFKFDGGDVHFVAADARPARAITAAEYPDLYNAEITAQYAWNEARVGIYSQPLGIVQRLIDKNSVWGRENGLGALLPEALTTSMRGFFYLMPDMVGGNQYDGDKIEPELLIRWAQASALMPLLQFSVGPWHHGPEAVRLCREASELHAAFIPHILRLAEAAMLTGEPILAPLAYHNPDDPETFAITDQYMIGPDVVAAPVLTKGAVTRDIYLPRGRWQAYKDGRIIEGGRWLKAYPAPLDTLPVFVRAGAPVPR
ncbi:MAG: glycoside hydrolase family 31 protein [Verrucomicrobiota bacterium]